MDKFSWFTDDEDEETKKRETSSSSDGRKPKAYVRFDQLHETQTGPMFGPFDGLELKLDFLTGWRNIGSIQSLAKRQADGLWYLIEAPLERGYKGFSVLFS